LEGSGPKSGAQGRTLEDFLDRVIVILIEAAELLRLFRTLQLSVNVTILRTIVRHHRKAIVCPQLPFTSKAVRRLHQCHELCGPQRSDERNLTQQFHSRMLPALNDQFSTHRVPQALQSIHLLVKQLGTAAYAGLMNLL